MLVAALCGNGLVKNTIFDRNSPANRDDCFAPYILLRERFHQHGIRIDTKDECGDRALDFELHQDIQSDSKVKLKYLLMFENELVKAENADQAQWTKYRKIFTWNDDLVDGDRFLKMNFPNPIQVHPVDGFVSRDRFCCLISSNRALSVEDHRNLYPERVKAIRWFETYAPNEFDLYGIGWNVPEVHGGYFGRIQRYFWKIVDPLLGLHPFPSYRGKISHKNIVLRRTKFSICYENVCDLPGYITEKIFDCFFSGCVPVYWGANNISDHIPSDCFIDRRQFDDVAAVYHFLKSMTELEFRGYQDRIASFLQSDAAYPFGEQFFAETVADAIVRDIGS